MTELTQKESISRLPEQSLDKLIEKFPHPHARALYTLINSKAIRLHPLLKGVTPDKSWFYPEPGSFVSKKAYIVDVERAIEVLSQIKSSETEIEVPQGREQGILRQSRRALGQSIKAFIANGDLTSSQLMTIGKLVRPSNIRITGEAHARYLDLGFSFPQNSGEREEISLELGLKYIFRKLERVYKPILAQNELNLTEEQILNILLRTSASHEYGHALKKALEILQWEAYSAEASGVEKMKKWYEFTPEWEKQVVELLPNQELADILSSEPEDGWYSERRMTVSERIATGFEYLGLQYALEEVGIDPAKQKQIMNSYTERDKAHLRQYKKVIALARARNLNLELLGGAVDDLSIKLEKRGRQDLKELLCFGFSARNLGYFYPFTKEEIHNLMEAFWMERDAKSAP